MKSIAFKRESSDFTDILTDPVIKKHIGLKLKWQGGLIIEFDHKTDEKIMSYVELKYGDDIVVPCKDRSPIPGVDYRPQKPSERVAYKD